MFSTGGVKLGEGEARLGNASGDGVFSDWGLGEAGVACCVGVADTWGAGVGDETGIAE